MRCTPSARTTVKIAAKPSGTAATASETESSSESIISWIVWKPSRSHIEARTITAITHTAMPRTLETRTISRSRGVDSSSDLESISAILPTCVRMPVEVTIARPVPCVTAVPLNTMLARSPNAFADCKVSGRLLTATDSPVRLASAMRKEAAAISRPSAETASPSPRTRISPGTTSVVSMRLTRPSRKTEVCGALILAKASTASSARDS